MRHAALLLLFVSAAWPQRSIIGSQSTPLGPGETETEQVGSTFRMGRAVLGVLRCPAGRAFVGMRLRRSSAVDSLQLVCAVVRCAGSNCGWSQPEWGPIVGSAQQGSVTIDQTCAQDSAVSGFAASTSLSGSYAYDMQLECRKVYSQSAPAQWARRASIGRTAVRGSCSGRPASAVSYAMGNYGTGIPAVQSISFYCGSAPRPVVVDPVPAGGGGTGTATAGRSTQPKSAPSAGRK